MKKSLVDVHIFLERLAKFIDTHQSKRWWVYSTNSRLGSLLIKDLETGKRFMFKPWDTSVSTGKSKIQDFIDGTPAFKGHAIDHYIFVARSFRDNATRYSRADDKITLIQLDTKKTSIKIIGSAGLDVTLMKTILEFADMQNFQTSYDFEGRLLHKGFQDNEQHGDMIEEM